MSRPLRKSFTGAVAWGLAALCATASCSEGWIVVDEGAADAQSAQGDASVDDGGGAVVTPGGPSSCPGATQCTPTECHPLVPLDPVIADWSDAGTGGRFGLDGGASGSESVPSSPWAYPLACPETPTAYPLSTSTVGALRVTGTVGTWSGFGLWMGCMVDLSAYSGLSFEIWGNAGPSGTLTFGVSTSADSTADGCSTNVGACPGGSTPCASPTIAIPVPADAGNYPVVLRWADLTGGSPVARVDATQVTALTWTFGWVDWGGNRSEPYPVDVSVGEIRLVP